MSYANYKETLRDAFRSLPDEQFNRIHEAATKYGLRTQAIRVRRYLRGDKDVMNADWLEVRFRILEVGRERQRREGGEAEG